MSHVVSIQTVISDLASLDKACQVLSQELGIDLKLVRNQKTFKWYGKWVGDYNASDAAHQLGIKPEDYGKCEHAITMEGAQYEIGVVRNPNGKGYVLMYDFWGGSGGGPIKKALRQDLGLLTQRYGVEVAKKVAKQRGYRGVTERRLPNGKIKLEVSTSRR